MTNLVEVEYCNFFGIGHSTVSLRDQGVVLVIGKNGAGKTSLLVEGVYYAMFGQSFEHGERPGPKVIKRHEKKFFTRLLFETNGNLYQVIRSKGMTRAGDCILNRDGVFLFSKVGDEWTEISESKGSDTQLLINSLIGLTPLTFTRSSLFSSDLMCLPDLPDSEKKRILNELLGIGTCDAALKATSEEIVRVSQELELTRRDLSFKETSLAAIEDELTEAESESKLWVEQQAARESKLRESKKRLLDEATEAETRHEFLSKSGTEIESKLTEVVAQLETATKKRSKVQAAFEKLLGMKPSTATSEGLLEKIRNARAGICPSCNRPFEGKGHVEGKIKDLEALCDAAREEESVALIEFQSVEKELKKRRFALTSEIDELNARRDSLQFQLRTCESKANVARTQAYSLKEQSEALQIDDAELVNPFKQQIERINSKKEALEADVRRLTELVEGNALVLSNEKVLGELFGNKGCRSLILEAAMPFLNQRCQEIAASLDSPISVSLSIRGDGESFASSLDIQVDNPSGNLGYHGNSAGERRLIDLIILFAFLSLAGSSCGALGQAFFDETFEKLHPEVKNSVLKAIKLMNVQRNSVFIVSHVTEGLDLDLIDQIWEVKGGVATVVARR